MDQTEAEETEALEAAVLEAVSAVPTFQERIAARSIPRDYLPRHDDTVRGTDLSCLAKALHEANRTPNEADREITLEVWYLTFLVADGLDMKMEGLREAEESIHRLENKELRDRILVYFDDLRLWMNR